MEQDGKNSASLLVVEDDAAINDVVCTRLRQEGYEPVAAFSGSEAQLLLDSRPFDLVITDLMLPGCSGEALVESIRARQGDLPVIVASARSAPVDKVALLELGADDYLAKPFDLDELAARVAVQLRHRRGRGADPSESLLRVGRWVIDPDARCLAVDGAEVPLTPTEFAFALLLAGHPKRVFSKRELFESVRGEPYAAAENAVSTHVSNLRNKLKATGTDDYIQTVWGIGFKLVPPA